MFLCPSAFVFGSYWFPQLLHEQQVSICRIIVWSFSKELLTLESIEVIFILN